MTIQEEKAYQRKLDAIEDTCHENKMREDSDYAFDCIIEEFAEEITKANELLQKVANEMEKYGIYVTPSEILKEI